MVRRSRASPAERYSGKHGSVNETNSVLYSGAIALAPVLHGVARGLSQLFPPVDPPEDRLVEERTPPDTESADGVG